ncbi:MAG: TIGR04141 family sporadically distributed protein [Atopobiaceae bacterium]|nr:TIGR04141 family sporadically distributed protein [Atopobiaceae bacterium]
MNSFFRGEVDEAALRTASSAAALLMEVRGRTMALAFGCGRFLLNTTAMEERFGLRVLLNSCERGASAR